MEHPNVQSIRRLFAAFESADVAAVHEVIPEDAVWHFPGRHGQLAGAHRGREGIFAFLMKVGALTDHTFRLELLDVVGGAENVVAVFRGRGERGGKVLDNPTCLRIAFRDGRVAEIWEFVWDLYAVDEFWS